MARMVYKAAPLPEVAPGEIAPGESSIPQPWNMVPLGRILTPDQLKQTQLVLNINRHNPAEQLKELKRYFGTIRGELEKQEIDPNYLAWILYATVNKVTD